MLKTETNTEDMRQEIWGHVLDNEELRQHENLSLYFEHGQWWVTCGSCGAACSVVDVQQRDVDSVDFEQVSEGDESCMVSQ